MARKGPEISLQAGNDAAGEQAKMSANGGQLHLRQTVQLSPRPPKAKSTAGLAFIFAWRISEYRFPESATVEGAEADTDAQLEKLAENGRTFKPEFTCGLPGPFAIT